MIFEPDTDGVYVRMSASPARRLFACGVLYGLGVIVIYLALTRPPVIGWLLFLLALGVGVLVLADRLRRATRHEILLTQNDLRDDTGRVLARLDDVVAVNRGAFALKPSNGFTLITAQSGARAWVPGMWWRMGRRVGVGGTMPAGPAKFMAEQIALIIAKRDQT